jgi:hypothetical protein
MARPVVALVTQVLLAIVVALLLGELWQGLRSGDLAAGAVEAARLLFFFMDIGLGVWIVLLIVLTVRRRRLPGIGATLLAALIGVVLNALTVTVVAIVQGERAPLFVLFAIEAGIAFLIAVFVTAPIIHRLFRVRVKPPREVSGPA